MSKLKYKGSNFFRQRLILSTLSGQPVKIEQIRTKGEETGVRGFETCFMELLDQMSNGSHFRINETGTSVTYNPGMLDGGSHVFDCNTERGIGYYLEAILCLVPFTKTPTKLVLRGVTNNQIDPSVDMIRLSLFPVLKRFLGVDEGLDLKINRRGAAPEGGGEVVFTAPCRQKLRPMHFTSSGKIKRIRGVAWATRVSPTVCNRMIESARSILNQCLPDIYIHSDHHKGSSAGKSPGFGITIVAETNEGAFLAAELASNPAGKEPTVPEDLGKMAARHLLEEVFRGGCVDSNCQGLAVVLMTLGDKDVFKLQTGKLAPYTIQYLRHIRDFFQVTFKLDVQEEDSDDEEESMNTGGEKILLTCVGAGYKNLSKITL